MFTWNSTIYKAQWGFKTNINTKVENILKTLF